MFFSEKSIFFTKLLTICDVFVSVHKKIQDFLAKPSQLYSVFAIRLQTSILHFQESKFVHLKFLPSPLICCYL